MIRRRDVYDSRRSLMKTVTAGQGGTHTAAVVILVSCHRLLGNDHSFLIAPAAVPQKPGAAKRHRAEPVPEVREGKELGKARVRIAAL